MDMRGSAISTRAEIDVHTPVLRKWRERRTGKQRPPLIYGSVPQSCSASSFVKTRGPLARPSRSVERRAAVVRAGCGKTARPNPRDSHGQSRTRIVFPAAVNRHPAPKIDPHGSPPYAGGILTHAQRTQGRASRCWRTFGCARRAVKNGLENRTPIEFNLRFSKRNVAAGSGRSTQIAPPSVPAMHAPEAILTFGAAGRQEARVRTAFCCF